MACGACMTHTNPEPCCDHDSSFGSLSGLTLLDTENPPWIQTAIGAAVAFAGYQLRDEESDLAVPLMLGGLLVPAAMWFKRAGREETEPEFADDVAFNGASMTRKGLIPAQDLGALALQSNPAHYGLPGSPGIRGGITRPVIYGTDEDASNINKERDRRSRGSGGSGTVQPSTGGGGVIIRSDGTVISLNGLGYGSPDADNVKKGLASVGAAGFGILGALIGAGVGAGIQFRGKPLKDGWLYGSIAGFMLPVILLAPKKDEAA